MLKRQNDDRNHGERRKRQKEIIAFKDHTRRRKRKEKFQNIFTSSVKTAVYHPKAGTPRKYLHPNWAESLLASPWH